MPPLHLPCLSSHRDFCLEGCKAFYSRENHQFHGAFSDCGAGIASRRVSPQCLIACLVNRDQVIVVTCDTLMNREQMITSWSLPAHPGPSGSDMEADDYLRITKNPVRAQEYFGFGAFVGLATDHNAFKEKRLTDALAVSDNAVVRSDDRINALEGDSQQCAYSALSLDPP